MVNKKANRELAIFLNQSMPISNLRSGILILLGFLVDFIMGVMIYADPYVEIFRNILVPPILLLNIFAFWIVSSPLKRQRVSRLYFGVFGGFVSLGYLILIHKILYFELGLASPVYGIIACLGAVLALVVSIQFVMNKVKKGTFFKEASKKFASFSYLSLALVVGTDLFFGFTANGRVVVFYMLSISMMFFSVIMTYRYVLIRRHPDLFVYLQDLSF